MESLLLELAWKSVVTSGGAILLLHFLRHRTAAERSMVAHAGLVATLLLPVAVIFLPAWAIEAPAALPAALAETASYGPNVAGASAPLVPEQINEMGLLIWAYLVPAVMLMLLTVAAVARLFVLRARASVLIDMPWLSALAHAQRRMGFKHGTALLVSDDLVSPVSWGVMHPVILLDPRALAATHEAEAIIAHELAHVARLDWAKLLVARLATAAFWFNPLVWKLAAECHQLREEAADDAVLHSQVDGADYASLLVGAARHENKALLLAAHGVAPGKSSLSRRVARVLDRGLSRAPARRTWALICSVAAVILSAPLAALTPVAPGLPLAETGPEELVDYIITPPAPQPLRPFRAALAEQSPTSATSPASLGETPTPTMTDQAAPPSVAAVASPSPVVVRVPSTTPPTPPVPPTRMATLKTSLAMASTRLSAAAQATAHATPGALPDVDALISRRIHGVTPEYATGLAAASPQLRSLSESQLLALRIHGVTPAYVRGLASAGYANLKVGDLQTAKIMGVDPYYLIGLAGLGYRGLSMREIVDMRARGVTPDYIRKLRRAGFTELTAAELVRMKIFGVDAAEFGPVNRPTRQREPGSDPDG